ncbi:hypothetical protein [Streptomyces sp. NPDC002644]
MHGPRLRDLVGRTLTAVRLVRDVEDGSWFSDCPVVLDFDGERLESNHAKLDDLSVTWNTVDVRYPVRWPEFRLEWSTDVLPETRALHGLTVSRVELLEWRTPAGAAAGTVDISLVLGARRVTVFNALDENGLGFGPPGPHQRVRPLRRRARWERRAR